MEHGVAVALDDDVEGGGDGGRGVDDGEIARLQVVGERAERREDRLGGPRRHEQADVVATAAAGLGRFVRLVVGVERERQRQRCDQPAAQLGRRLVGRLGRVGGGVEEADRAHRSTSRDA